MRLLRWLREKLAPTRRITAATILGASTPAPTIDEQCRAILVLDVSSHPAWAVQQLGLPADICQFRKTTDIELVYAALHKAFTLTREDFEEYLVRHGIEPETQWVDTAPSGCDGPCLVKTDQGWQLYYQERGGRYEIVDFANLGDVRQHLINVRIGSWLKHLHRPVISDAVR